MGSRPTATITLSYTPSGDVIEPVTITEYMTGASWTPIEDATTAAYMRDLLLCAATEAIDEFVAALTHHAWGIIE